MLQKTCFHCEDIIGDEIKQPCKCIKPKFIHGKCIDNKNFSDLFFCENCFDIFCNDCTISNLKCIKKTLICKKCLKR